MALVQESFDLRVKRYRVILAIGAKWHDILGLKRRQYQRIHRKEWERLHPGEEEPARALDLAAMDWEAIGEEICRVNAWHANLRPAQWDGTAELHDQLSAVLDEMIPLLGALLRVRDMLTEEQRAVITQELSGAGESLVDDLDIEVIDIMLSFIRGFPGDREKQNLRDMLRFLGRAGVRLDIGADKDGLRFCTLVDDLRHNPTAKVVARPDVRAG